MGAPGEPPGAADAQPSPWPQRLAKFVVPVSLSAVITLAGLLATAYAAWRTHQVAGHTATHTNNRFEPYLEERKLDVVYKQLVPPAVQDAAAQYNRDARMDLELGTQDFQTRDAPGAVCDRAREEVIRVIGPKACDPGSKFLATEQTVRRYDRTLIRVNASGSDPRLSVREMHRAMRALAIAESRAVGCTVENTSSFPVNVTLTVSPGYKPLEGDQPSAFTLDAHRDRTLIYQAGGIPPDAGFAPEEGCSFDAEAARKAQGAPVWLWLLEGVVIVALGLVAVSGRVALKDA